MIELYSTGNLRSVANSAWVSTLSEAAANRKSDDEVLRVSRFLVEHYHTTPFESITLTFSMEPQSDQDWDSLRIFRSNWVRITTTSDKVYITTDLFNFIKIMMENVDRDQMDSNPFWKLLNDREPEMAGVVRAFSKPSGYVPSEIDYEKILGEGGAKAINVELISLHKGPTEDTSRATWRVACPLSVAVQLLRHRTGSFNMTSGRYRTLKQDIVGIFDDIVEITGKAGGDLLGSLNGSFSLAQETVASYETNMRLAKKAKDDNLISSDEYKRLREFYRYVLPEGRITELYVSFYLNDFKNYMMLRESKHAQVEHGFLAYCMNKTLQENVKN